MKKMILALTLGLLAVGFATRTALTHCQIPCGIYDDPARFTEMREHLTTVEKSMTVINQLAAEAANGETPNVNQMVRWVSNKEEHADQFSEIVTHYFMTQRIKPAAAEDQAAYGKYVKEVTLLHQMLVLSMKAKQTTDLAHVQALRTLLKDFETSYLAGK